MVTEDQFIIAIELGSSKVTGIAGKKLPDGSVNVLTVIQETSSMFIRRGMIFNHAKSTQCISSIISRLSEHLKRSVNQVYVGFGGQSIHSTLNMVSKPLGGEVPISKEVVDSLLDENFDVDVDNQSILDTISQEYVAGKEKVIEPVGVIADHIEGKFLNIIARPSLKSNIESCFNEAGYHVAGYLLTPICEANFLLTDAEKRSGCVFVDFGADTTSVSLYKDNILRHIAVIPLGSANITKDIESRQLDEAEAEQLKINEGCADDEDLTSEQGKEVIYNLPDGSGLTKMKFNQIVEARMKEILVNVAQQIKDAGFDNTSLIGGAILIGGGSNIKNLTSAFVKTVHIDKVRIVKNLVNVIFSSNVITKQTESRYAGAVSLLNQGTDNCCGPEFKAYSDGGIFAEGAEEQIPQNENNLEEGNKDKEKTKGKVPKGPSVLKKIKEGLIKIGTTLVGEDE